MHGAFSQIQISTIVIVVGASWRLTRLERVAASDWSYIMEFNLRLILLEVKLNLIWLDDAVCVVHLILLRGCLLLVGVVSAHRCLCAEHLGRGHFVLSWWLNHQTDIRRSSLQVLLVREMTNDGYSCISVIW